MYGNNNTPMITRILLLKLVIVLRNILYFDQWLKKDMCSKSYFRMIGNNGDIRASRHIKKLLIEI